MKLWKKILPIASAVSAVAVVTPLVTSCGKGTDLTREYTPKVQPHGDAEMNSTAAVQEYAKQSTNETSAASGTLKDDLLYTLSCKIHDFLEAHGNLIKHYNVSFDDSKFDVDGEGNVDFGFTFNVNAPKVLAIDFGELHIEPFKNVKFNASAYFTNAATLSFKNEVGTEKGDLDHTKLVLNWNSDMSFGYSISGSVDYKTAQEESYKHLELPTKENSINFSSTFSLQDITDIILNPKDGSRNLLLKMFFCFMLKGESQAGKSIEINCPYFRNVTITGSDE